MKKKTIVVSGNLEEVISDIRKEIKDIVDDTDFIYDLVITFENQSDN